ncbi:hypothetical protein CTI12_AA482060 [Artemisia annua]|uniref:Retrotransposon Copia-like N-terminal domain-containing protein n=1 Tax=Artemisia annua TaxID=35608 RepID=A0A2U1LK99_ARTAN|nr:hypothetical protein CTI12_AA482060 [Artemisia annua]
MTSSNQPPQDLTQPAIFQNPLYLHPSDGPASLTVQEKLIGAQNYRAWRRAIEIGLSTKRKLGFIKGTVIRSTTDPNLAELWDTCNNMVICWIMGSVSESIAKSIMFVGTASEIWSQLEKRFSLSDGSRKYKLNKDTYAIAQSGGSVGEYYTKMKCVWEELDNLNVLPVINNVTPEVSLFLAALNKQREEQRLFQFLNGLDECYSHQRSQILMIVPLPNVESACSLVQQEESQRMLFGSSSLESTALFSKGHVKDGVKDGKCSICGFKWHPPERCWEKVGYPAWHPKNKFSQSKQTKTGQVQGRNQFVARTAAHVESGNISFTPQQFEQLLKSFQQMTAFNGAEEEIDHQFVAGPSVSPQTVPETVQVAHHTVPEEVNSQSTSSSVLPQSQVPTRKSTRTTTVPTKLKDFVLSHVPKANQARGSNHKIAALSILQ